MNYFVQAHLIQSYSRKNAIRDIPLPCKGNLSSTLTTDAPSMNY